MTEFRVTKHGTQKYNITDYSFQPKEMLQNKTRQSLAQYLWAHEVNLDNYGAKRI